VPEEVGENCLKIDLRKLPKTQAGSDLDQIKKSKKKSSKKRKRQHSEEKEVVAVNF
jgi:hypothetical protein